MAQQKHPLRKQVRILLESISPECLRNASISLCEHISACEDLIKNSDVIAIFSAYGKEIDLSALHDHLPDKRLAYPRCLPQRQLAFHIVASPETMTSGTLGISEPDPDRHAKVDISEIDLFLCPGLAFGRDGSRLGHGGGYYDRALAKKSAHSQAWGVGMDMQLFNTVPNEAHDQRLNGIITESGIIHAKPD